MRLSLLGALPTIGGSVSPKLHRACAHSTALFSSATRASIHESMLLSSALPRAQSLHFVGTLQGTLCLPKTSITQPFSEAPFEGPAYEKLGSSGGSRRSLEVCTLAPASASPQHFRASSLCLSKAHSTAQFPPLGPPY